MTGRCCHAVECGGGIELKTLRKHFREELDRGSLEATAKVAQPLFQMATTGKNVAAIFRMKARAVWREKSPVEHGAAGAVPVVICSGVPQDESTNREAQAALDAPKPPEG